MQFGCGLRVGSTSSTPFAIALTFDFQTRMVHTSLTKSVRAPVPETSCSLAGRSTHNRARHTAHHPGPLSQQMVDLTFASLSAPSIAA
jgi:hypothetical protein